MNRTSPTQMLVRCIRLVLYDVPSALTRGCVTVFLPQSALILVHTFRISLYDKLACTNLFKLSIFSIWRIRQPVFSARSRSNWFLAVETYGKEPHLILFLTGQSTIALPPRFLLENSTFRSLGSRVQFRFDYTSVARYFVVSSIPKYAWNHTEARVIWYNFLGFRLPPVGCRDPRT